jgi:hypothetical protein
LKVSLFFALLLFFGCPFDENNPIQTISPPEVKPPKITENTSIETRIAPPQGYERTKVEAHSFPKYLRTLKLKPIGSHVKYFNGASKPNNGVYHSVIDLPIGKRDLHQCADAIMRLRAEYLWKKGAYDQIHFNFTNGFRVNYSEWMKGRRMVIKGNKTYWNNRNKPSNTYKDFWAYMELIFSYAGTASLEKELKSIKIEDAEIGDVLIQGAFPGHAVLIIDQAIHPTTGKKLYLLAQSYMPAQETQVLNNPNDSKLSPWYELEEGTIYTPEWTFKSGDLRRFEE